MAGRGQSNNAGSPRHGARWNLMSPPRNSRSDRKQQVLEASKLQPSSSAPTLLAVPGPIFDKGRPSTASTSTFERVTQGRPSLHANEPALSDRLSFHRRRLGLSRDWLSKRSSESEESEEAVEVPRPEPAPKLAAVAEAAVRRNAGLRRCSVVLSSRADLARKRKSGSKLNMLVSNQLFARKVSAQHRKHTEVILNKRPEPYSALFFGLNPSLRSPSSRAEPENAAASRQNADWRDLCDVMPGVRLGHGIRPRSAIGSRSSAAVMSAQTVFSMGENGGASGGRTRTFSEVKGDRRAKSTVSLGSHRRAPSSEEDTVLTDRLDLADCGLSASTLLGCLDALGPRVRRLDLSGNRLLMVPGSSNVLHHPSLARIVDLDLSSNRLGVVGVRALCSALMQSRDSGGLDGIGGECLGSACVWKLRRLNLASNAITYQGGVALASLLRTCETLLELRLCWNELGPKGAIEIARALTWRDFNADPHQEELSPSTGSVGVKRRSHDANCTLLYLDLGANAIGSGSGSSSRRRRDFGRNVNPGDHLELGQAMMQAIFSLGEMARTNTKLLHLDLSFNALTPEACDLFGERLANNHTLLGVHLEGNGSGNALVRVDDCGFVRVEHYSSSSPSRTQSAHPSEISDNNGGVRIAPIRGTPSLPDVEVSAPGGRRWLDAYGLLHTHSLPQRRARGAQRVRYTGGAPLFKVLSASTEPNVNDSRTQKTLCAACFDVDEAEAWCLTQRTVDNTCWLCDPYSEVTFTLRSSACVIVREAPSSPESNGLAPDAEDAAAAAAAAAALARQRAADEAARRFTLDHSVFAHRREECDSRSYYDALSVMKASFAADWGLLARKLVRFVKGRDTLGGIKSAVWKRYDAICNIFKWYCCASPTPIDAIGFNDWIDLCDDCGLVDGVRCTSATIEVAFVAANVELKDDAAIVALDKENPDKALFRHEMLEAIIRVAIKKFGSTGDEDATASFCDEVKAFERMIDEHVLVLCDSFNSNEFRRDRLYFYDIHCAFISREWQIKSLWGTVSGGKDNDKEAQISFREWQNLMAGTTPSMITQSFTATESTRAFCLSNMKVKQDIGRSNKAKRRDAKNELSFTEFLEAVVHCADMQDPEELGLPPGSMLSFKLCRVLDQMFTFMLDDKSKRWLAYWTDRQGGSLPRRDSVAGSVIVDDDDEAAESNDGVSDSESGKLKWEDREAQEFGQLKVLHIPLRMSSPLDQLDYTLDTLEPNASLWDPEHLRMAMASTLMGDSRLSDKEASAIAAGMASVSGIVEISLVIPGHDCPVVPMAFIPSCKPKTRGHGRPSPKFIARVVLPPGLHMFHYALSDGTVLCDMNKTLCICTEEGKVNSNKTRTSIESVQDLLGSTELPMLLSVYEVGPTGSLWQKVEKKASSEMGDVVSTLRNYVVIQGRPNQEPYTPRFRLPREVALGGCSSWCLSRSYLSNELGLVRAEINWDEVFEHDWASLVSLRPQFMELLSEHFDTPSMNDITGWDFISAVDEAVSKDSLNLDRVVELKRVLRKYYRILCCIFSFYATLNDRFIPISSNASEGERPRPATSSSRSSMLATNLCDGTLEKIVPQCKNEFMEGSEFIEFAVDIGACAEIEFGNNMGPINEYSKSTHPYGVLTPKQCMEMYQHIVSAQTYLNEDIRVKATAAGRTSPALKPRLTPRSYESGVKSHASSAKQGHHAAHNNCTRDTIGLQRAEFAIEGIIALSRACYMGRFAYGRHYRRHTLEAENLLAVKHGYRPVSTFGAAKKLTDAVRFLLSELLWPRLRNDVEVLDPEVFRRQRMLNEPVDVVLKETAPLFRELFMRLTHTQERKLSTANANLSKLLHTSGDHGDEDILDVGTEDEDGSGPLLHISTWLTFLINCGLITPWEISDALGISAATSAMTSGGSNFIANFGGEASAASRAFDCNKNEKKSRRSPLTLHEARIAFLQSRNLASVSDTELEDYHNEYESRHQSFEKSRRSALSPAQFSLQSKYSRGTGLSFADFVEALLRVADLAFIPSDHEMRLVGVRVDTVRRGTYSGSDNGDGVYSNRSDGADVGVVGFYRLMEFADLWDCVDLGERGVGWADLLVWHQKYDGQVDPSSSLPSGTGSRARRCYDRRSLGSKLAKLAPLFLSSDKHSSTRFDEDNVIWPEMMHVPQTPQPFLASIASFERAAASMLFEAWRERRRLDEPIYSAGGEVIVFDSCWGHTLSSAASETNGNSSQRGMVDVANVQCFDALSWSFQLDFILDAHAVCCTIRDAVSTMHSVLRGRPLKKSTKSAVSPGIEPNVLETLCSPHYIRVAATALHTSWLRRRSELTREKATETVGKPISQKSSLERKEELPGGNVAAFEFSELARSSQLDVVTNVVEVLAVFLTRGHARPCDAVRLAERYIAGRGDGWLGLPPLSGLLRSELSMTKQDGRWVVASAGAVTSPDYSPLSTEHT